MANSKNKPQETQTDSNNVSSSMQETLAGIEKKIEEYRHENETRVLEAKVSVGESRVTNLLIFLGLLGIFFPFYMTNRNSDRVDEAIKDMENRFKELAGEYLRKPDVVCETDGAPLSGRTLIVGPNPDASQSFVIRNAGDASAGTASVFLLLRDAPAEPHSLARHIGDFPSQDAFEMDQLPSDDKRFGIRYLVASIAAFHAKREYTVHLCYSPKADEAINVEVPAMLKVYYDGPQPTEIPFTVKLVSGKR